MISYFKDMEMKNSGVIYNSTLEQIKTLYEENPELAGELAISAIELVLTGDISSSSFIIKAMLEPTKKINEANQNKYERKVENTKNKTITEQKLDQIAELYNAGYKQKQIGDKLGMSQQVVSYRLGVIRTKYPELLQKDVCNTKVQNGTNFVEDSKNTNSAQFDF